MHALSRQCPPLPPSSARCQLASWRGQPLPAHRCMHAHGRFSTRSTRSTAYIDVTDYRRDTGSVQARCGRSRACSSAKCAGAALSACWRAPLSQRFCSTATNSSILKPIHSAYFTGMSAGQASGCAATCASTSDSCTAVWARGRGQDEQNPTASTPGQEERKAARAGQHTTQDHVQA